MTTIAPTSAFIVFLRPSKAAVLFALLVCCLFLTVCLRYFPFKLLSTVLIIAYFILTLHRMGCLPYSNTLTQVHILPNNKIRIVRQTKETAEAIFLDSSVLTRFVSVLHFRVDGCVYRYTVFPDSTDKKQYRKLIVYAKWHKKQSIPINTSSFEG